VCNVGYARGVVDCTCWSIAKSQDGLAAIAARYPELDMACVCRLILVVSAGRGVTGVYCTHARHGRAAHATITRTKAPCSYSSILIYDIHYSRLRWYLHIVLSTL